MSDGNFAELQQRFEDPHGSRSKVSLVQEMIDIFPSFSQEDQEDFLHWAMEAMRASSKGAPIRRVLADFLSKHWAALSEEEQGKLQGVLYEIVEADKRKHRFSS